MFKLMLVIFSLSVSSAFAAPKNDLCICQTGTEPRKEVGFFKLGCKVWNAGQSCKKKMTVSFDRPMDEILARFPEAKKIRVGYVGHWASADESVKFLEETIVPAIRNHGVSFSIDNTACLATDNPYRIVKFLKSVPEEAPRIEFRGNQAISSGLWDKILEGRNNFWARISGETLDVAFPTCESFENKICAREFQLHGTGVCADEASGSHYFLRCEEKEEWVTRTDSDGRRTRRVKVKRGRWTRMAPDYEVREYGNLTYVAEKSYRFPQFSFSAVNEAQEFLNRITTDVRELLMKDAEL